VRDFLTFVFVRVPSWCRAQWDERNADFLSDGWLRDQERR
jgi:hypothetical protein